MKQLEEEYKKIGVYCPFALSRHLGVRIAANEEFGQICGMYMQSGKESPRMFINYSLSQEAQEDVCEQLIRHHLSHPGIMKTIDMSDYDKLKNDLAEWKVRRFLKTKMPFLKTFLSL